MNRLIKFRGRRADNGEWVYGSLINNTHNVCPESNPAIIYEGSDGRDACEVDPDTVGQFTGLTDSTGKEIYEGDIVRFGHILNVVKFKYGMFGYEIDNGEWFVGFGGNSNFHFQPFNSSNEHEVVGNVFDNPELIDESK